MGPYDSENFKRLINSYFTSKSTASNGFYQLYAK